MRQLVIGDLHFGIKTNSLTWLEQQLNFFDAQVIPTIQDKNIDRILFLGDVFDIRYAINQQIGIEVKKLIRKLSEIFKDKEFYFVAGNHDYYSPLEEFAEYNAYELVFGEEFLQIHDNIKFINKEPVLTDDGSLFLPWYYTENTDHFDEILYNYDFKDEVRCIFCHADLQCWPGARIASLRGCPIYSGHIHYIFNDEIGNLHNVGAAYPLTFNDVNQSRYIYIIEDFKEVEKIENITTPKFKRIYDEDIFNVDSSLFENSYIQICISSSNINKAKYIEQLKYLKSTYIDSSIRIHVIDDDTNIDTLEVHGFNTNITKYIEDNIPEHLDQKYNYIKDKLNEK